jgi:hypothetical protein
MKGSQSDGSFILEAAGSIALTCRSNRIQQQRKRMERILAKVEAIERRPNFRTGK